MKRFLFLSREFFWLAPFLFLVLCALALTRPWVVIPVAFEGDAVTITNELGDPYRNRQGNTIQVPASPRRVAPPYLRDYLPKTHAPELLAVIDRRSGRKDFAAHLLSSIYPELLEARHWREHPNNMETLLAENMPGDLYFGSGIMYNSLINLSNFGFIIIDPQITPASPDELAAAGVTLDEFNMF